MAFEIYGKPSCPECSEPIAPKAMAFSCGSCGHQIEPRPSCGGARSIGCIVGFALLLISLGTIADLESSRFHDRIRLDLSEQIRCCVAKNRDLTRQLSLARDAAREADARDARNEARIEALRDELLRLSHEKSARAEAESKKLDDLLRRMVDITTDNPLTPEQARDYELRIDSIAREGLRGK